MRILTSLFIVLAMGLVGCSDSDKKNDPTQFIKQGNMKIGEIEKIGADLKEKYDITLYRAGDELPEVAIDSAQELSDEDLLYIEKELNRAHRLAKDSLEISKLKNIKIADEGSTMLQDVLERAPQYREIINAEGTRRLKIKNSETPEDSGN